MFYINHSDNFTEKEKNYLFLFYFHFHTAVVILLTMIIMQEKITNDLKPHKRFVITQKT